MVEVLQVEASLREIDYDLCDHDANEGFSREWEWF